MIAQQHINNLRHIDWTKVPRAYSLVTVNSDGRMFGHAFDALPVLYTGGWRFECPYGSVVLGRCYERFESFEGAYTIPSMQQYRDECYGEDFIKAFRY